MKRVKIIWIIVFIIGFILRSTELLHPVSTESWREGDMATIAKNFYQNGSDIFHPQVAWDGKGTGYVESEFQIYTYLIATSYKIFGFWEPAGRIISFLFSIGTMLVFFRFSRYLLKVRSAIAVSLFFAISPMLQILSNTLQPESVMFFFYILSVYTFIRWLDSDVKKYYLLALIFTALTLLCKITSAHIGFLFIFLILTKKGWRYLYQPKILFFGLLSIAPAITWYLFSQQYYFHYGNSLGISNEYPWAGLDFFTNPYFILGILGNEINNVWTLPGIIIIFLALCFTKIIKFQSTLIALFWLAATFIFYILTSRTTADGWAYYYHVFSIPAASILLGSSVIEVFEKYSPFLYGKIFPIGQRLILTKGTIITGVLFLLVSYYAFENIRYFRNRRAYEFITSEYYLCKPTLLEIIPKGAIILASGGPRLDPDGYQLAINKPYFFYWLGCKGYNIAEEDQSIENVIKFKEKGASFYIAEIKSVVRKPGYETELNNKFEVVSRCNGIILYKL